MRAVGDLRVSGSEDARWLGSGWFGKVAPRVTICVVACIALAAIGVLHDDYGITWDEPVQSIYGDLVRAYFVSGGVDRRADTFLDLRYYGPLADLIPSLIHPANDLTKYEVRHVICGLFALLALGATWKFAGQAGGRLAAAFAVLALATMPRFVGHAFDNMKDIPFAAAVAVFMTTVASMCTSQTHRRSRVVVTGMAAGLVLCARPGGFPMVMAMLVGCIGVAMFTIGAGSRGFGVRLAVSVFPVLAVGWLVMVLPWPYAHLNPLWHPIEAMLVARSFPNAPDVLFDGVMLPSAELPRSYLIRMLFITSPPVLLLLAAVGVAQMMRAVGAQPRSRLACVHGMLATWVALPLAGIAIMHPKVYDGIRHVLFVLPGLAVVAGVGAASIIERKSGRRRVLWGTIVAIGMLSTGVELVRLHPYQTTYYNAFVGGLRGAEGRYETDYWVSSYREAFTWVNERAAQEPNRSFRVLVAGNSYIDLLAALYRAPNVHTHMVQAIGPEGRLPAGIDFSIATSRWGFAQHLFPDSPVVHSIGRGGAVFTVIRGDGVL